MSALICSIWLANSIWLREVVAMSTQAWFQADCPVRRVRCAAFDPHARFIVIEQAGIGREARAGGNCRDRSDCHPREKTR